MTMMISNGPITYYDYVTEMRERLSVNPLTILYSSKSVKYISLTLELATCTHTYFVHVITMMISNGHFLYYDYGDIQWPFCILWLWWYPMALLNIMTMMISNGPFQYYDYDDILWSMIMTYGPFECRTLCWSLMVYDNNLMVLLYKIVSLW